MSSRRLFSCAALLAVLLGGCDPSLDLVTDPGDRTPYYVAGYLDTAADTQFVRVDAVRPTRLPADASPLDAVVTTTELRTGAVVVWRDSLATRTDGTPAHLFWATFRPEAGRTYRLAVARSDGAETTATTALPARPPVTVGPAEFVSAAPSQSVLWANMRATPEEAAVIYEVAREPGTPPTAVAVPYAVRGSVTREGWRVRVRLGDDQAVVRQALGLGPTQTAYFHGLRMRIERRSDEWDLPADVTDVENGLGFFGAVGRFTTTWKLSDDILAALDYVDRQP